MFKLIKKKWRTLSNDLLGTNKYWQKSPSSILFKKNLIKAIKKYSNGQVLDTGAGSMAYRPFIEKYAGEYKSLDYKQTEGKYNKNKNLDYIGDIQNMPIKNDSFDAVFCTQVLEHVSNHKKAIEEISRVLKKGGHLILTVPFLGYLHNEPHDFYRFTEHGLKDLLEKDFNIIKIEALGGIFSFFGYVWSTFVLSFFYKAPLLWEIVFYINYFFSKILIFLDQITKNSRIFPLNYLIIAVKK